MKKIWYTPKLEIYSLEELTNKVVAFASSCGGGCLGGCPMNCPFGRGCTLNF